MSSKVATPGFAAIVLGASVVTATLCQSAHAQESNTGVYIGGNFARALNSFDTGQLDRQIESEAESSGESLGLSSRSVHRFDWVWWADAGYFFSPYVALEADYLHLGEFRYKSAGQLNVGGMENSFNMSTEITSHGPALALVGRLPLTESLEADLRVGDYVGKTVFYQQLDIAGQGVVIKQSKTKNSLLAVVGAAYTFAGHWSARLDYLRVEKTGDATTGGKFSVNLISAGLSFTF